MTSSEPAREQDTAVSNPSQRDKITQDQRLHDHPLQVVRLSRKVLAGGTALALAMICGAVLWALQDRSRRAPDHERSYSTDHHDVADELANLPRDYGAIRRDAPPLGKPLPGGLGQAVVAAHGSSQSGSPVIDAEQQRADQETEAARTSKVFASTNVRPSVAATPASSETTSNAGASSDETFAQNGQDRKIAFVNSPVDRRTTSADRLARPASAFVVQAGTVIPAALITGIRSDLPGQITAQVTERVYDTPTGRALLIPQGARLIGTYDSQVAFGQSRVLLVWTRLIMPNGRSIVLERQPGADAAGYSGLEDEVDNHWRELLGAAALSTLLSMGTEVNSGTDATGSNDAILQALRRGAGDSLNQTGQQVVRRNLNIQPTLTIRPGFPVRVMVNRDLVLEPFRR
jgi:type IV secretion system protein TrbI